MIMIRKKTRGEIRPWITERYYAEDVKDMVRQLEPYLKGHKPRTEKGLIKILQQEWNNNYHSMHEFYDW